MASLSKPPSIANARSTYGAPEGSFTGRSAKSVVVAAPSPTIETSLVARRIGAVIRYLPAGRWSALPGVSALSAAWSAAVSSVVPSPTAPKSAFASAVIARSGATGKRSSGSGVLGEATQIASSSTSGSRPEIVIVWPPASCQPGQVASSGR